MIFKMALIHGMPMGGHETPRETGQLRTGQLRTAARGYNTFVRIYAYLYVFRYPILGGATPGGPPPPPQPIHLWRLLFRLHAVAHAFFVICIVYFLCGIAQANLLLTVARVVLLLHFPRFPFHDSTDSHFCCFSYKKP